MKRLDRTAGRIMSRGFLAVHEDVTVAEAIERLPMDERAAHSAVIYVVDDDHLLLNVVPVPELFGVERPMPMKLMPKVRVVSVTMEADRETVVRIARRYHLLVIPLVDRKGRLVGSITAQDLVRILQARKDRQTRLTKLNDRWSQPVVRWIALLRQRLRGP